MLIRPAVLAEWRALSEPLEGRVPHMYLDVKGLVTCGVGNWLATPSAAVRLPWRLLEGGGLALPSEIAAEWRRVAALEAARTPNYYASRTTLRLDDETIDELVFDTLYDNAAILAQRWPAWPSFPADAQLALLSLAWAVGPGLNGWPKLCDAVARRDWLTAADESHIREDGNPGVAPRNRHQKRSLVNAAIVDACPGETPPDVLWWPRALPDELPSRALMAALDVLGERLATIAGWLGLDGEDA